MTIDTSEIYGTDGLAPERLMQGLAERKANAAQTRPLHLRIPRPVCPGCADVGVVEHAGGAVELCECAGAAQAVPVIVEEHDGEADQP